MATRMTPPKKVRLACRRCRVRRIKVPACTNCAKAGQICLDVDSQNSSVTIPRNFAGAARARIEWLEDIIRRRLPDIDLQSGPQIGANPDTSSVAAADLEQGGDEGSTASPASPPKQPSHGNLARRRSSLKRPAETSDQDDLQSDRAQSIAVSLGMLSLNSDSSQKHYMGSSSGLLFTNLIGASPSSAASTSGASPEGVGTFGDQWNDYKTAGDLLHEHHQSLYAVLRQELPRKEDAVALAQTYIRWVHPDFPVLEPAAILGALDSLYYCLSYAADDGVVTGGWPASLPTFRWNGRDVTPNNADGEVVPVPVVAFIAFMVFNIASIVKIRSRVYEYPPERYYRAAQRFAKDCFSQISLSSIQALVLLINQCMLTPGEANLWTLLHIALAHCVELGIHREPSVIRPEDSPHQQTRRFLFFTIYGLDRSISSIQGRPLGFRDETFDLRLPEPQTENHGATGPIPPSFSAAVTQFSMYSFQLDRTMSDIKMHFYHLPKHSEQPVWFPWVEEPQAHQDRIQQALDDWWDMVSRDNFEFPSLDSQQRRIWKSKLKIRYHTAVVLLNQPSQAVRNPSSQSLLRCFDNASSILHEYQLLNDLRGLQHGWWAVQNTFAAGATIIYSFWTSDVVRRSASIENLSKSLRICTSLLALGGEWWPSVKSGLGNFGAVADLTMRKLYTDGSPAKTPRLSLGSSAMRSGQPDEELAIAEATDTIPSQVLPSLSHEPTNIHLQLSQMQSAETTGAARDPWLGLYPDTEPQGDDFAPEIGSFLANFDNADFTWSFPLNSVADPYDAEGFPQYDP